MSTQEKLHETDVTAHGAFARGPSLEGAALFLDADGTLLDIAATPEAATAPPGLAPILLKTHHALGGALAIVSGRRVEEIDRLFAPERLPASGVHGAQIRNKMNGQVEEDKFRIPLSIADGAAQLAQEFPGVIFEDKHEAVAVHWRMRRPLEAEIYDRLARLLHASGAEELSILRGHCVFEIKRASVNKGVAVRAFMRGAPFAGRRPIFVGDDVTDVDGIHAARALGGHAFSVGRRLPGAVGHFENPAAVRAWLAEFVRSDNP